MARDKLHRTRHPGVLRRERDNRLIVRAKAKNVKTGKSKEVRETMPAGATVAEALVVLARLKVEAREGEARAARPTVPTVRGYVPRWTASRLSTGKWNADGGTVTVVGRRLDNHILPHFGDFLIDRITYSDLADWLAAMVKKGLMPTTIEPCYSHLRCLIVDARRDLGLDPLKDWPDAPKPRKADGTELSWSNYKQQGEGLALTVQQLAGFLDAAERLDAGGWYPVAVLGFGSSARFSELSACECDDLDLAEEIGVWLVRRHLIVERKTVAPGTKYHPEGVVRLLDAVTTARLRPYWQRRRLEAGARGLMFPSAHPSPKCVYRSHQGFQKFLDRVSDAAGLPRMTSKVMRRTYLTLTELDRRAGAMAQAQAGHGSNASTLTYVTPSVEARKDHARKVGDVLYLKPTGTDSED